MFSDEPLPLADRGELRDRLLARRLEIEQTTLACVCAIDDPAKVRDPEYAVGLENLVSETIGFGIEAIAGTTPPPIPILLYPQARLAARNGVSLDTVARRYMAGYVALAAFVEEVAPDHAPRLRHFLWRLLDNLVEEAGKVYALEAERNSRSRESRRAKLAEELLAGKPVDSAEFAPGFDFDSWHIAAIATGARAIEAVGRLAKVADRRILKVRRGEDSVWAWLAGRDRLESTRLQRLAAERMPADGCLAFGEAQAGLPGWRLSHHQAADALRVGLRRGDRIVRYGEVSMQASVLQDPVLSESLRQRYLVPLGGDTDGGQTARRVLRTYFSRDRNVSATAGALGVARQTVAYRLRTLAERLGVEDLHGCAAELEAALDLDRFDRRDHAPGP